MPEQPWGPDIAPHAFDEFEAAALAGAWAPHDSPLPAATFENAALPWLEHDWFIGYLMASEGDAVFFAAMPPLHLQAVQRASFY